MGHIFITAANAVLPIVLLIVLGYFLRQKAFLSDSFLQVGNKLVFTVCLPITLFLNVYSIENIRSVPWDVILYCAAIVLILFLLGLLTAIVTTKQSARRGVLVQCVFRSNFAIIGLPLAAAVGGPEAEVVASAVSAFLIPLFNILAVVALTVFDSEKRGHSFSRVLLGIAKNPLILGTAAAFLCILLRQVQSACFGRVVFSLNDQLPFVFSPLTMLKNCTTPLALIVMGGQFRSNAVKALVKEIFVGTAWRIVLAPVLGVGLAILLTQYTTLIHFGPNEFPTLVALFGSPVAVSSAIMAKQMGGDQQLATQYVFWTSLLSVITVFLLVSELLAMGFL